MRSGPWSAHRSRRRVDFEYDNGDRELYDLQADQYERYNHDGRARRLDLAAGGGARLGCLMPRRVLCVQFSLP